MNIEGPFRYFRAPDVSASSAPKIATKDLPHCIDCGGLLRPHVVWFGENLDPVDLGAAEQAALSADICLVVGTSSVVYPAAGLVLKAAKRGIPVAEINLEPTPATSAVPYDYFAVINMHLSAELQFLKSIKKSA
ncbi:unnamed protein product [Rodentolepis nana]|uniref:Deacetylase sirtuin-type domain-containing protein n=1 Tax=Rodentolepis nana TaxID=102285 RepID=A0A0R3TN94_RODNA|nr:unnamed protein product [Rodentolepis nana]